MFKFILKLILHITPFLTFFYTENFFWALVNLLFIVLPYIKVKKIEVKLRQISVKDRLSLKKNLRFWRRFTF